MSMVRFLFLGGFLFLGLFAFSQKSVNNYKYIVVPESYEFLGKEDAYQLNSLTKFLFNKHGFKAFIRGDEVPEDLFNNGCKGLQVYLRKNSSLFVTKLILELKDCRGELVFASTEGTSREKDFKNAYHEALRNAFKDVERLNYKYEEIAKSETENTKTSPKSKNQEKTAKTRNSDSTTKIEAPKKETSSVSKGPLSFTLNDNSFMFKSQEYGYELFKKKGEEFVSLGKIYQLNRENSYIITAGDLSGAGYFDNYGNFILERVNPVTNKIILDTFARE